MAEDTQTIATPTAAATVTVGAGATPAVRPLREQGKPDKGGFIWGTGRRKRAIARVRIKAGSGKFMVNARDVHQYFVELRHQGDVHAPLDLTQMKGKVDVFVNAHGGGFMGQAGAVKLGLARALMSYDPTLEVILREHSMLSRDSRKVERKKYGQAGARRRFQFSKR